MGTAAATLNSTIPHPLPDLVLKSKLKAVAVKWGYEGGEECIEIESPSSFSIRTSSKRVRFRPSKMSYRRDTRASKSALFDGYGGLEEGLRASDRPISDHDNDKAIDSLQDRVIFLKRLTGDIHDEVESHNRMLDHMGSGMDASRGIMSGTMDRFKKVFEKKTNKQMCKLAGYFVVSFLFIYFLIRFLGYFMRS
ncbi:hypothetical protein MLD38_039574 [Melastoma candidum]|uniref:Uncharacterized protein n=1 Tax=Melastoma candidum TaxID=119954 RepID=A0ACB9L2U3_9MYRT|nr:hypothetical protein MLD38_039574 [Melastoma candidum]